MKHEFTMCIGLLSVAEIKHYGEHQLKEEEVHFILYFQFATREETMEELVHRDILFTWCDS